MKTTIRAAVACVVVGLAAGIGSQNAPASPTHYEAHYCAPGGDFCEAIVTRGGVRYISVYISSTRSITLCVTGPSRQKYCDPIRLKSNGDGTYSTTIRWTAYFPNEGPGIYRVHFAQSCCGIYRPMTFRVAGTRKTASGHACVQVFWRSIRNGDQQCPQMHSMLSDIHWARLHWTTWSRSQAIANGVEVATNAICSGTPLRCRDALNPIRVRLARPQLCPDGRRIYTHIYLIEYVAAGHRIASRTNWPYHCHAGEPPEDSESEAARRVMAMFLRRRATCRLPASA